MESRVIPADLSPDSDELFDGRKSSIGSWKVKAPPELCS